MNTLRNIQKSIFAGVIICICLLGIIMPQATNADYANYTELSKEEAVETFSDLKAFIIAIETFLQKEE